jgi:hypothetical protein
LTLAAPVLSGVQVVVDLAARAAGAGVAHLPEVVLLVAGVDALGGQVLEPQVAGLVVGVEAFASSPSK